MALGHISRTGLTGGNPGDLDNYPVDNLSDGYRATVITGSGTYHYIYNESSGKSENPPSVIVPNDAIGDEAWETVLGNPISLNKNIIDQNWEIPSGYHGCSVGPLQIEATVEINGVWEVI